ncbi:uncharacterized protein LOC119335383 isoform X3 [Triticum dicoccoides]|uniref:uncharacterized protein LOC119335383 isoform X3 n=1 Tax=Triticum dicoccoides TaxID=85692 RepID=UPI001891D29C|nr:uncharacterized protein LOC119335383 isoform X3 [Triticum dicoccoides]
MANGARLRPPRRLLEVRKQLELVGARRAATPRTVTAARGGPMRLSTIQLYTPAMKLWGCLLSERNRKLGNIWTSADREVFIFSKETDITVMEIQTLNIDAWKITVGSCIAAHDSQSTFFVKLTMSGIIQHINIF